MISKRTNDQVPAPEPYTKKSLRIRNTGCKEREVVSYNSARICKRLWSPGIDSEESISPAYVAWRASTTNRISYRPARPRIDTWSP
jgi:hypothetical protein